MAFHEEKIGKLRAPLDPSRVATRKKGKTEIEYLEAHDVIRTANEIFGFDGWSYRLKAVKPEVPHQEVKGRNGTLMKVYYKAVVELTVRDDDGNEIVREDVGYCDGQARDISDAMDVAIKGAVSDALKRCFRTFGDQFGNVLYDKELRKRMAEGPDPDQVRSAYSMIMEEIGNSTTPDEVRNIWKVRTDMLSMIYNFDHGMYENLKQAAKKHKEALEKQQQQQALAGAPGDTGANPPLSQELDDDVPF